MTDTTTEPSVTNPTPIPAETPYLPPRLRPQSAAQKRKAELKGKSRRLHVIMGKPGTLGKIASTQYVIGPRGNLQKVSGQDTKDRKPTKRGGRGR